MRFKLWVYMSDGHVTACVQDTGKAFFDRGAVLLRDQSSYPEDGGKMVWKNASCPTSVMHAVKTGKGFVLAESDSLFILDANIQYSKLYNMWKVNSEIVIG